MMVTSTRLLARNTVLNLAGQIIPLGVAVVAVPILIHALGTERFGILTLAWALIGYFALLDFGLGRALTQAASEAVGRGDSDQLKELGVLAIRSMILFGVAGGIVAAALTPWLANSLLKMDPVYRSEAAGAFYLLALSLPFVLGTIGFRALLEAHQHFGLATALRLPYSVFNFVGPLFVLPFSRSLVPVVAVLVIGRVLMFAAHLVVSLRHYPWLRGRAVGGRGALLPILRTGGWMMVSNVVSPVMVYLDRFFIGALISVTAVAYYVTPFELVSKLLIVPASVIGVFFPAFAATFSQDRDRTAVLFDRASRVVLMLVFPVVLIVAGLAREILHAWVGPAYAAQSTAALQLLAVGVLVNSFAQAPFALLQAVRRPDVTAKLHLVEVPIYIAMILLLGRWMGVTGVALAWTLRVTADTAALCWFSRRELPELARLLDRSLLWLAALIGMVATVAVPGRLTTRVILAGAGLVLFAFLAWRVILTAGERAVVREYLPLRSRRPAQA
jgi:O-antigen/teichoic acid export membrane protein